MSIHSFTEAESRYTVVVEPEWMKSERYDYCDGFALSEGERTNWLNKLVSFFK